VDDGKSQIGLGWELTTNLSGAFFPGPVLTEFLYGHKHKIDPAKPVHKLVVVMKELAGGDIIMQFDMPDPTTVAEACGVIKQKH
jgi:hypothetical protein